VSTAQQPINPDINREAQEGDVDDDNVEVGANPPEVENNGINLEEQLPDDGDEGVEVNYFAWSPSLFLTEDARKSQGIVRNFIAKRTGPLHNWHRCWYFPRALLLELTILFTSVGAGPYFIVHAALELAMHHWDNGGVEQQDPLNNVRVERQNLLNMVITIVEACFESAPQLALQVAGTIFLYEKIPWWNILSIVLSILAIIKALVIFLWNRSRILEVLHPMRIIDVAGSSGYFVDQVKFRYDDGQTNAFGESEGGHPHTGIHLEEGEVIIRVEGDQQTDNRDWKWLGYRMKFTTNRGQEFELVGNHYVESDRYRYDHYDFELGSGITGLLLDVSTRGENSPNDALVVGVY
jgi:hypothetical protein